MPLSALYVWRNDEPAAIFRYAAVRTCSHGLLGRPADCTLPAPMRLLLDGEVDAGAGGGRRGARRRRDSRRVPLALYARLAQPSEVSLNWSTVLCETSGTAKVSGSINGELLDFVGTGVFEFLHG